MMKKIFPSILAILMSTLLVLAVFSYWNTRNLYYDFVEDGLNRALDAMERSIEDHEDFYNASENLMIQHTMDSSDYRITLIQRDGVVVYDTDRDAETLDNHADRPEVRAALSGNPERSIRYSESIGSEMMYKAVPVSLPEGDVGVLRASMKLELTKNLLTMSFLELGGLMLFSFTMAAMISRFLLKYMLKPVREISGFAKKIASGDYEERMTWYERDEMGDLASSLNHMADRFEESYHLLTDRNEELEVILKSILDGIIAVDGNFRIKIINQSALLLLGQNGEGTWLDVPLRQILPKEKVYRCLQDMADHEDDWETHYLETHFGEKTVRMALAKIDRHDKMEGFILVLQDVTQIRRLESLRRDFVANVSHELKTPITSIKGFVETLQEGVDDEVTRNRFYDIVLMETDRLIELVEDILTLSMLETEEAIGDLPNEWIAPGEILLETVELASTLAVSKSMTLQTQIEEHLPQIAFKGEYFKQMCLNLLDNAIKYSPEGSTVFITLKRKEDRILLEVADKGMGISLKAQERIFERFYRVEKGRGRKEGGTGLGLAIVKHIVQSQGATIQVKSALGEGSRFIVTIPLPDGSR